MSLPWGNCALGGADKQGNALNSDKTLEWPKIAWQLYQPWGKKGPSQAWVFLMTANLFASVNSGQTYTWSLAILLQVAWISECHGEAGAHLQDSLVTAIISYGVSTAAVTAVGTKGWTHNEHLGPDQSHLQEGNNRGLQEQHLLSCS